MEAMEAMARRAGYGRGWKIIHHLTARPTSISQAWSPGTSRGSSCWDPTVRKSTN
jgi:hypothetical protein